MKNNLEAWLNTHLDNRVADSSFIIISIGIYILNDYIKYEKLSSLPEIFHSGVENIISVSEKAFCISNDYITRVYLLDYSEDVNSSMSSSIILWLNEFQRKFKTIGLGAGIDRRKIKSYEDIQISEQMAGFRMYKDIFKKAHMEEVYMGKQVNFIGTVQKILGRIIEYSNTLTGSDDIMEVNCYLDELINKHYIK